MQTQRKQTAFVPKQLVKRRVDKLVQLWRHGPLLSAWLCFIKVSTTRVRDRQRETERILSISEEKELVDRSFTHPKDARVLNITRRFVVRSNGKRACQLFNARHCRIATGLRRTNGFELSAHNCDTCERQDEKQKQKKLAAPRRSSRPFSNHRQNFQ